MRGNVAAEQFQVPGLLKDGGAPGLSSPVLVRYFPLKAQKSSKL